MSKDGVIILLVLVAFMWWAFAIWFSMAVGTLEEQSNRLLQRVRDIEKLNKEKCVDLFMQ